jgi:outer membrane lipoprotein SlyB
MKKFSALILVLALVLSACARNMSSNSYKSTDSSGKVVEGVIVSARAVQINEAESLGDNAMGGLAGGVAGGVAGSAIGSGTGQSLATVGGVIAGALLGAAIQSELSNSEGTEYIVKIGGSNQANSKQKKTKQIKVGTEEVSDSIKDSIETNMQTEMVSVVQQDDIPLQKGQRVYVIYTDGRPRITAAY